MAPSRRPDVDALLFVALSALGVVMLLVSGIYRTAFAGALYVAAKVAAGSALVAKRRTVPGSLARAQAAARWRGMTALAVLADIAFAAAALSDRLPVTAVLAGVAGLLDLWFLWRDDDGGPWLRAKARAALSQVSASPLPHRA